MSRQLDTRVRGKTAEARERGESAVRSERVIVVGAGMGGLAAALDLASRGIDTVVLERAAHPGGKLRSVPAGGVGVDSGPTVLTMRWVLDELLADAGTRLDEHLSLAPAALLARHAWNAHDRLDLFADLQRSADAIGTFAGAAEARGYLEFCARAQGIYRTLEVPFLRGQRPGPVSLSMRCGLRGLPGLARISPFATLWQELGRHFRDPRLRQLFGRYATYCGSSPFAATATLMLVAHVEQAGVWLVGGGMQRIAETLSMLAQRKGARLRTGVHVDEILVRDGRVTGVQLADGERIEADAVVFNGDAAALAARHLGGAAARAVPPTPRSARSLSAVTWSLRAPTDGFPLVRHNVFFGPDYASEFGDIFGRGRLPAQPTVYVCAQDRPDGDAPAPAGAERLLCLVNAPPAGDAGPLDPLELATCEERTFRMLASCGLQVDRRPDCSTTTTPADFERLFPATGGALYGRASHGWMASFVRPGSRSRIAGLYLAGGSTHPGPGVPMAALSGRLAVQALLADRASRRARDRVSTGPSPAAATPGGTSTP